MSLPLITVESAKRAASTLKSPWIALILALIGLAHTYLDLQKTKLATKSVSEVVDTNGGSLQKDNASLRAVVLSLAAQDARNQAHIAELERQSAANQELVANRPVPAAELAPEVRPAVRVVSARARVLGRGQQIAVAPAAAPDPEIKRQVVRPVQDTRKPLAAPEAVPVLKPITLPPQTKLKSARFLLDNL